MAPAWYIMAAMHHDQNLRPVTSIRPRKLPNIAVSALLGVASFALLFLRRDLSIALGQPAWLILSSLAVLALTLCLKRLFYPGPLIRISPEGVELPALLATPLHWQDIKSIQATTRRGTTGDVHDRLLFHLKRPQIVQWQTARLRRLFGDTPQAAIAIDIGFNWPCRADEVKRIVHEAARTYAKAPPLHSDTMPPRLRFRRLALAAILVFSLTLPGAVQFFDFGLARQFSTGLTLFRKGEIALAVPYLEQDARAGDREAAFALGSLYLNGDGVVRNAAMAAGWFRRAAEAGHGDGAYNLGNAYRLGLGTQQNLTLALQWYRYAADHGSAIAAFTLGRIYRLGDGVRRDYPQAIDWLKIAAERKFAPAEQDLGQLYQEGIAVPRDLEKAIYWYQRAASRGHTPAIYDLARLMLDGNTAQRGIGLTYLIKAAESGFAPAQRRLAAVYLTNQTAETDPSPNPIIAYKWIALAERTWPAATRADLVREKARVAALLNADQLAEATTLIREWRPTKE